MNSAASTGDRVQPVRATSDTKGDGTMNSSNTAADSTSNSDRKAAPKPDDERGDRFVRKRVAALRPSPENLELYDAVLEDDPEVVKLAESIRKNGLHESLVVTEDNYIVSGHRRHTALWMIGQSMVKCRVLPVCRDSMSRDEVLALLRDHNRQRYKSAAEQVREELVDIDPEKAHRKLRHLRDKSVNALHTTGCRPWRSRVPAGGTASAKTRPSTSGT